MDNTINNECQFCKGTGITKSVDLTNPIIPNGKYSLNELIEDYGDYSECCEGCRIMN